MLRILILGWFLGLAGCSTSENLVSEGVELKRENFTPPKSNIIKPKAQTKTSFLLAPDKMIPKTVVCEAGGDQRQIEMRIRERGCELVYSKEGIESILATSTTGTAHCLKVQNRVRDNLSAGGFDCR